MKKLVHNARINSITDVALYHSFNITYLSLYCPMSHCAGWADVAIKPAVQKSSLPKQ